MIDLLNLKTPVRSSQTHECSDITQCPPEKRQRIMISPPETGMRIIENLLPAFSVKAQYKIIRPFTLEAHVTAHDKVLRSPGNATFSLA
jgi:hypothetical protein